MCQTLTSLLLTVILAGQVSGYHAGPGVIEGVTMDARRCAKAGCQERPG